MNMKSAKNVTTVKPVATIFKPFANRTVEEEISQVEILLNQATDEDAAQAFRDLLKLLQDELQIATSPTGKGYYEMTPTGHLRITSDVVTLNIKSVIRTPELENLFPALPDQEFDELKQSLMNNGLLNPLLVTHEDKLICGYNRLRSCEELGITKVQVRRRYCVTPDHAKAIAIADNLIRRHFSPSESIRTMKALEMIGPISLPELAQKMNVSTRIVKRLKSVADCLIPELRSLIGGEQIPMRKAELIAGLSREHQEQIYELFKVTKTMPEDSMLQDMKHQLEEKDRKIQAAKEQLDELTILLNNRDNQLSDKGEEIQELRSAQAAMERTLQETRKQLNEKKVEDQNYSDKLKRIEKETKSSVPDNQDQVLERMFDTAMYTLSNFRKSLVQARAKKAVSPERDADWMKKISEALTDVTK